MRKRLLGVLFLLAATPAWAQTQPGEDPQAIVRVLLDEIRQADNVSIDLERQERTALDGDGKPDIAATMNRVYDASQHLRLQRPGRFKFSMDLRGDGGMLAPTVVLEGERLTIGIERYEADAGWKSGRAGAMPKLAADAVLSSSDTTIPIVSPELARLIDPDSVDNFLGMASEWKMLSSAIDNGTPVIRVGFDLGSWRSEAEHWELSLTRSTPRRLVRIVVNREKKQGVMILKPGVVLPPAKAFPDDQNDLVQTIYQVAERSDLRFDRWDLTTPIPADTFMHLKGNLTETAFESAQEKLDVGEKIDWKNLPALSDTAGNAVDLKQPTGPIVLDFWFAQCGPCMVSMPQVHALLRDYPSVRLIGVNDTDTPDEAAANLREEGWQDITTLMDANEAWQKHFSIRAYPTVIVLTPDGTIVYRDSPTGDGAMVRLKKVLDQLKGNPPAR